MSAFKKGEKLCSRKFRKSQKGFTLIELLIVVAIIGILAAIAIPQFSAYRQKAYNSAANSDLKNLKTGFEAYKAEISFTRLLLMLVKSQHQITWRLL